MTSSGIELATFWMINKKFGVTRSGSVELAGMRMPVEEEKS
jgi:hypothetical protein